jgi:hypothetical protein
MMSEEIKDPFAEITDPFAEITDPPKIVINSVTGGDETDVRDLTNCYFQVTQNPGEYHLYNQLNFPIWTAPMYLNSNTRNFRFIYGGFLWTVTSFQLSASAASGNWHNNHNVPEQDEGHFQAQAGGGFEESASSATA